MPFALKSHELAYRRQYTLGHKKQKRVYDKIYRAIHAEKKHAADRAYHWQHRIKKNASSKQWRKDNPKRYKLVLKKWHLSKGYPERLKHLYGITIEQYNKALALQGGVCALCGKPPKTKRLSVDHVHSKILSERRVRGLLDYVCNKYLIGRRKAEHAELFRKAADYLESSFDIRSL